MASISKLLEFCAILLGCSSHCCGLNLSIEFHNEFYSEFAIILDEKPWFIQALESSHIFVTQDGKTFSTSDQSLRFASGERARGQDSLGSFALYGTHWLPSHLGYETTVRVYNEDPLVVFTQRFQVPYFHDALILIKLFSRKL